MDNSVLSKTTKAGLEVTGDNVKTSNFYQSGDNGEICGSYEDYLTKNFDEAFKRLSHSESLQDVLEAFKIAETNIGKHESVTALMLYHVHNEKIWIKIGYVHLNDFILDLSDCGIGTRSSFYNFVNTGRILSNSLFLNYFKIPPSLIHKSYSKIRHLEVFFKNKNEPWPWPLDELKNHFLNDSYDAFKAYTLDLQAKIDEAKSKRLKERGLSPIQKGTSEKKPKPCNAEKNVPETLEGTRLKIYLEIKKGHDISFLVNTDPSFCASIVTCIDRYRNQKYDGLNNALGDTTSLHYKGTCLKDVDLAELVPGEYRHSVLALFDAVEHLSPKAIKDIIENNFRRETDYLLAEAYLIRRIDEDQQLRDCFHQYGVSSTMDFAVKILGISLSQGKRLKKIGRNLPLLDKLQGEVDLTAPGFMEKVYFLDMAIKNHNHELALVVDFLKNQSAKQFREFARDPSYRLDSEPIGFQKYKKARTFIEEYDSLLLRNNSVEIIGLRSEDEKDLLNKILRCAEIGEEHLKKWYPDIIWVPSITAEIIAA